MADPCSRWSYDHIIKSGYLGERQARVLAIFTEWNENCCYGPDITGAEVAEIYKNSYRGHSGKYSETIRNRITELCNMGFLVKFARKECPLTGELVNTFKWTGRKIPLKTKEIDAPCPKCKGTGWCKKRVPLDTNDHPELF